MMLPCLHFVDLLHSFSSPTNLSKDAHLEWNASKTDLVDLHCYDGKRLACNLQQRQLCEKSCVKWFMSHPEITNK